MKFWTVQKKEMINLAKENIYQPDFRKSVYLKYRPELKELYELVLNSYNKINNTNLPGLIFAFLQSDGKSVSEINNFDLFYSLIQRKKSAIRYLWEELRTQDALIVELAYDEDFNPIVLDFNDFQFLMPPIKITKSYTEQDIKRICQNISNGIFESSPFPTDVIQAHLPYIKKENIVNRYPMFDLK